MRQWIYRFTRVRTPGTFERNHADVRSAFRDVVRNPNLSTVRIVCNQTPSAIGIIIDSNGLVLTKASELSGSIQCVLFDKRRLDAKLVGKHLETDLALLKIEAKNLPVVEWNTGGAPPVGSWLATPGLDQEPVSIGVVSVAPRAIPAPTPLLGVELEQAIEGARVQRVVPGSGADKAGVQPDDVIKKMDDSPIKDFQAVAHRVGQMQPGKQIKLVIARAGHDLHLNVVLGDSLTPVQGERAVFQNNLGGPLSNRRAGFPQVLQHDSVLRPNQCGGALVDLDGKAVGINIARAGRVESYALPVQVVLPVIEQLKQSVGADAMAANEPISRNSASSSK